jgi:hypothetical protein
MSFSWGKLLSAGRTFGLIGYVKNIFTYLDKPPIFFINLMVWRASIVSNRKYGRFRSFVWSLLMSVQLLLLFSNTNRKLEQCLVKSSVGRVPVLSWHKFPEIFMEQFHIISSSSHHAELTNHCRATIYKLHILLYNRNHNTNSKDEMFSFVVV